MKKKFSKLKTFKENVETPQVLSFILFNEQICKIFYLEQTFIVIIRQNTLLGLIALIRDIRPRDNKIKNINLYKHVVVVLEVPLAKLYRSVRYTVHNGVSNLTIFTHLLLTCFITVKFY